MILTLELISLRVNKLFPCFVVLVSQLASSNIPCDVCHRAMDAIGVKVRYAYIFTPDGIIFTLILSIADLKYLDRNSERIRSFSVHSESDNFIKCHGKPCRSTIYSSYIQYKSIH